MTLRTKVLLATGLTLVGLLVILYLSQLGILSANADQLEKQSVHQNVERALDALSDSLVKLDSTTRDYAWWDDTYAFVEDGNEEFIKSNLGDETLENLRVSFELYVNSVGRLIVGKGFNLDSSQEIPLSTELKKHLASDSLLLKHRTTQSSVKGIVILEEGVILVASRPILTSQGTGPIRGTLIMGRFLNDAEIKHLSEITHLSLTLHRWDNSQISKDVQTARATLLKTETILVQPLSSDFIAGYTLLKDIYGQPALVLRVESSRPIYEQSQVSLRYMIAALIVAGLVFGIVVFWLLEKLILSRLHHLSLEVARVGERGIHSAQLAVVGGDELANLATTINKMLRNLESSEQERHQSEERFRLLFESASDGIYMRDADGTISYANRRFFEIHGLAPDQVIGRKATDLLLLAPEERERYRELIRQALARGESPPALEAPFRRPDGSIGYIQVALSFPKEGSKTREICGISRDVTDFKQKEEALRKAEERYRGIFEESPVGLYRSTPDGVILEANPALVRMLGCESREDVRMISAIDVYANPADRERWMAQMEQQGGVNNREMAMRRRDGQIRWVIDNSRTIRDAQGQVLYYEGALEDITQRKELELQLQASKERYRDLIENASDLIITLDLQGNFLYGNKRVIEFSGYSYEELINQPLSKILVEEDLPRAAEQFVKARQRNSIPMSEYRVQRKDGSIATVEVNSRLIEKEGEIVEIQMIARDVTEKKKFAREQELLLSISKAINNAQTIEQLAQEALQGLTEILDVPSSEIYLYDPEANELRSIAERGQTREIKKRTARQRVSADEPWIAARTALAKQIIVIEDMLTSPLTQHGREEISQAQLQSLASIPLVAEGQLQGVLQVATKIRREFTPMDLNLLERVANELALDIARKRAEEALARSEEAYRNLVENAGDGIYTLDRLGRFTSFNRKIEVLTGYSRSEVLGKPYYLIIHPKERRKSRASFIDNLRGKAHNFEILIRRKRGQERVLELSTRPLYLNGRIVGIQGIARDITERKQLEKMKDEFVSMVSHDLRTPLTSIKGYADLILAGDVGPINPEQKEFLEIISRNTTRLANLINDLLDIDRLQSGRVLLELKPLLLNDVLQEVAQTFRVNATEKALDFQVGLGPYLEIDGDRERLVQVFANLLSNAIKYTPRGSVRLQAYADAKAREAVIEIADSGIGISREEQQYLFQKFYRAENPYTRQIAGTGLGLAIAKAIVDQHRGKISVESQQGQGSTFIVRLPLHKSLKFSDKAVKPLVLIIEDEQDIARLIKSYIERMGYRTVTAHSSREGLRQAHQLLPDLITLDVMLPDMDGFETIAALKRDAKTRDIPVIFLSIMQDRERGLTLGASAYLTKPIHEEVFQETVRKFLDKTTKPILVVDDDRDFCQLMLQRLTREGFSVEMAHDGKEALDKIRRRRYQLILLDKNLPEKSGVEVLLNLRAVHLAQATPVIMFSDSVPIEDLAHEMEVLGAKKYLNKKLDIQELLAEITRYVRRESKA